jgi:hypothetical protein
MSVSKRVSISDTKVVQSILDKAAEVFKIPTATLKGARRYGHIQRVRMAISNIARVEHKIHYTTIAGVINRDRSSIYHYERQHETWYITWKTYQKAYDLLSSALSENAKPNLNKCQIKRLIKEAGIVGKKRGKCKIIIASGNTSHSIKSDLYEFPATIEKLKPILEQYEHNLDIQI